MSKLLKSKNLSAWLLGVLFLIIALALTQDWPVNSAKPIVVNKINISGVPICAHHDPDHWHPPFEKDQTGKIICVYGHEHGDAPPKWVGEAGYEVGFDNMAGFMANTSEMENMQKHVGMKGFEAEFQGLKLYARIHLASNVLDRSARYHSYELFIKDKSGAVSHFQGWLNTGDPVTDRIPYHDSTFGQAGLDPHRRPIVWGSTKHACTVDHTFCTEFWNMTSSNWGPTITWAINDPTTYFRVGEKYDLDISHWDLTGNLGGLRTISVSLQRDQGSPQGKVWATQFGDIVSGPEDPICKQKSNKFGVLYQNVCLENYLASSLPKIDGIDNIAQKQYDLTGVEVPN
jgi:hypothetical protein